jgi:hypothetical protein
MGTWLSFHESVGLIRERTGSSIGRAQALVRAATASGEVRSRAADHGAVRPVVLTADDGITDMRPGAYRGAVSAGGQLLVSDDESLERRHISRDDLLDWLNRTHPTTTTPAPGIPAGPPKTVSYKAYADHQRATRRAAGRWASRDDDNRWAKENNYVARHVRDALRRQFAASLPPKDRAQFQRKGRRK